MSSWLENYRKKLEAERLTPKQLAQQAFVLANREYNATLSEYRACRYKHGMRDPETQRALRRFNKAKRALIKASEEYDPYLKG